MTPALLFPLVDDPLVTIVMVAHGARAVVAESLQALRAHTPAVYRLVIVDSASPDDTPRWLVDALQGADVVLSERNIGYGAGSNLGAERARSRWLLFMNPDVLAQPGWLPPLLAAMERPRTAAAGPRLLYPDGRLQAAGSLVARTGTTRRYGDGDLDAVALPYRFSRHPDYLSGACLLVERRAFHDAGGFDPAYGLGYYEDVDLCFTLAAEGYRLAYVPESTVVHLRDASGGSRTLADTVAANHRLFEARWREVLKSRPPQGYFGRAEGTIGARDARATSRVLSVGSEGAEAAQLVLEVDPRVIVTVAGRTAPLIETLVEVVPCSDDWATWFRHRRHHYDIIVGHDVGLEPYIAETQPLARRVDRVTRKTLVRVGCAPWPGAHP